MKRIFTLLLGSALVHSANGQLLIDNFNYTGLLTDNGWSVTGTNVTDPVSTTTGLTYTGYPGSGVGNAANIVGANQDVNRGFANQTGAGTTIWMTAMVRVTEAAATTGGYFLHLGDRSDTDPTSFTLFSARIFAKTDATGIVNFGLSNSSTAVYGPTNFTINTTYLMVVKYTINLVTNDEVSMWIIQSGVPVDETSLGTPEVTSTAAAGQDNIDAVGIRQASGIPDVILDGLKIGNSYVGTVLPLNLTSFKASLNGSTAKLNWTSQNEINVKGFSIEKSLNGTTFSEIAFVKAKNGSTVNTYSAEDVNVKAGVNYYRLKMVDVDGAVRYSNIVLLSNKGFIKAEVFPNPAFSMLTVSHNKAELGAVIRIMSIEGKQVKLIPVEAGAAQTALSVNDLVKGNYLLVYEANGEKATTKFSKQ